MNDDELEARLRGDLRDAADRPLPDALARAALQLPERERAGRPAWWTRALGGVALAGAAVVAAVAVLSILPSISRPAASPPLYGSVEPSAPARSAAPTAPTTSPPPSVAIQTGPFIWRRLDAAQFDGVTLDALVGRPDGTLLGLGRAQLIVPDAGPGWSTTVWQSSDGAAWARVPGSGSLTAGTTGWNAVALAVVRTASGYVAVGMDQQSDGSSANAAAWYSADGAHWERAAVADPDGRAMDNVVATGAGLVALGESGYTFHAGMGTGTAVWTSSDGRSWSRVPAAEAPPLGTRLSSVIADPSGGFLAAAASEYLGATTETVKPVNDGVWRSRDAVHWSPVAGSPLGVASMAVRGDTVVAVGSGGRDLSQPALAWTWAGGGAWTESVLPFPPDLPQGVGLGATLVVRGGPGLLAVGQRADGADASSLVVWSSSDGVTWAADSLPAPLATAVLHAFPLGRRVLVVGVAQPDTGPVPVAWSVGTTAYLPPIPRQSPGSTDPGVTGASDVPCAGGNPCGP